MTKTMKIEGMMCGHCEGKSQEDTGGSSQGI